MEIRVAEDEDASDIWSLVEEAQGNSKFSISKIKLEDIENDCMGCEGGKCWLLLEIGDIVIGAARFSFPPNCEHMVVDFIYTRQLGSQGTPMNEISTSESSVVIKEFLARIDAIGKGHKCEDVVIEVAHWRENILDYLTRCGYEDKAGHESFDPEDTGKESTMIIEMRKSLQKSTPIPKGNSSNNSGTSGDNKYKGATIVTEENDATGDGIFLGGLSSALTSFLESQEGLTKMPVLQPSNSSSESMDDLVNTLFRALHAENDKA